MSKRITVPAGGYIVYCPAKGGTPNRRGGWFKAEGANHSLGPDCNVLAKVRHEFSYEDGVGEPYESLLANREQVEKAEKGLGPARGFDVVRRYYATKNESNIVTEETLAAEHAKYLEGELSHTGLNA